MNTGDPQLNLFLSLMLMLVSVIIIIFIGLYVVLPCAIIYVLYLIYRHFTKPKPITTEELYKQSQITFFPTGKDFTDNFMLKLTGTWNPRLPSKNILIGLINATRQLYDNEKVDSTPFLSVKPGTREEATYRDQLIQQANKARDPLPIIEAMHATLTSSFNAFGSELPSVAFSDTSNAMFHVSLQDTIPNLNVAVQNVVLPFFYKQTEAARIFKNVRETFKDNMCSIPENKTGSLMPIEYKGNNVVDAYLTGTPLKQLFECTIPFDFTDELKEHGLLLAASGWGKTQLLQSLTLRLLSQPDPPSIIILNSQGKMLDLIQRLAIFAPGQPLSDRLVIIDPEDEVASPALNAFSVPTQRINTYSRNKREQVRVGIIETLEYLVSSVSLDLTGKMTTAFQYICTLVLSHSDASFNLFLDVLQETTKDPKGRDSKYAPYIANLDIHAQGFFENQYFTKSFTETRQQIGQRIYRVLNLPALSRMLASTENRIDLFTLMQSGSVILCNTSKNLLGKVGSAFFGRWIMSMIIRAAYERVDVRNPRRTIVLIDEASDYVDEASEELFSKIRQFNIGCLMAFQNVKQITILQSILTNTAVKLAGGVGDFDARAVASDMRTTKEFLMDMRKIDKVSSQFATHIRGMTTSVRLTIPYFMVENAPKMSAVDHHAVLVRNRHLYSTKAPAPSSPPTEPIVNFTPRPAAMEKWRLEGTAKTTWGYKKPDEKKPDDDDTHTTPSKDY